MIFIVRTTNPTPPQRVVEVELRRRASGTCFALDDDGGGVAVWGNGQYWEVRATPFDVIAHD